MEELENIEEKTDKKKKKTSKIDKLFISSIHLSMDSIYLYYLITQLKSFTLIKEPIGFAYSITAIGLAGLSCIQSILASKITDNKIYTKISTILLSLSLVTGAVSLQVNGDEFIKKAHKFYINKTNPFSHQEINEIHHNLEDNITYNKAIADEMINAINRNPHLSDKEKENCMGLYYYYLDNPYLNAKNTYENLATLTTDYSQQTKEGKPIPNSNAITLADYERDTNNINVYYTKITSNQFQHEIVHATGHIPNAWALKEGMTELITAEYTNNGIPDTYFNNVLAARILCELITPEKMLEAYSKMDRSIIDNELLKLSGTKEDIEDFYQRIEALSNMPGRFNPIAKNNNEEVVKASNNFISKVYFYADNIKEDQEQKLTHIKNLLTSEKSGITSQSHYFNKRKSFLEEKTNSHQKIEETQNTSHK